MATVSEADACGCETCQDGRDRRPVATRADRDAPLPPRFVARPASAFSALMGIQTRSVAQSPDGGVMSQQADLRTLLMFFRDVQPMWNHWISEHGTLISVQRWGS